MTPAALALVHPAAAAEPILDDRGEQGDGDTEPDRAGREIDRDPVLGSTGIGLRAAEAAALVGDRSIVVEHVGWLRALSEARGEPAGLTAVAVEALAGVAPEALRGELAVQV